MNDDPGSIDDEAPTLPPPANPLCAACKTLREMRDRVRAKRAELAVVVDWRDAANVAVENLTAELDALQHQSGLAYRSVLDE